jgi:protein-tyrosine phosphatase
MKIQGHMSYHNVIRLISLTLLGASCSSVSLLLEAKGRFGDLYPESAEYKQIRDMILDYQSAEHGAHHKASRADEIIPGLYVGSQRTTQVLPSDVSLVISCRSNPKRPAMPKSIAWKVVSVEDKGSADITQYFDEVYTAIEGATTGVLIHCKRGMSRSPSFIIAYLMKKFDVPYEATLRYVCKKHPACNPNSSFERQLKAYGEQLKS